MKRFPWVALGVLCILVVLEIFVFRACWFWAAEPRSDAGIYYVLEDQIRSSKIKPRIVLFGDSRLREAVSACELEKELGFERGEVLNLALTAGTPWDANLFLRRNPSLLDSAVLVLCQVSDWQSNENFPPTNRVRRFAKLKERLAYRSFSRRTELVISYFLQTVGSRQVTKGHIERLLRNAIKRVQGKGRNESPLLDSLTGRIQWRLKEAEVGPDSVDVSEDLKRFYLDFACSERVERDLNDLIRSVRESGAHFVLLELPVRDVYLDAAKSEYPGCYQSYREVLMRLAAGNEMWGDSLTKQQVGIPENFFYDYGHLTLKGKTLYTRWLATRISGDSLF